MNLDASYATVSAHIVTLRWAHVWRTATQVRVGRRLAGAQDARFSVCGRTSGGAGPRQINRTLSLRRTITIVEWASPRAAIAGRRVIDASWERRAEVWSALLIPLQSKGTFNGSEAFVGRDPSPSTGPFAALTYAQIRPSKMGQFYVRNFPKTARRATGSDSAMLAGVGFGDVPIRHACTFSVWPSTDDIVQFAYDSAGTHGPVQAQSRREHWLSESLFARFSVADHEGSWSGTDPLCAA